MSNGKIIECSNLKKRYKTTFALNDMSLTVDKGRIVGLLGPNGSGKTTLIKILNGLLTKDNGTALIDGMEVGPETKNIVSYLSDKEFLDKEKTIMQLLDFYQDFYQDFRRDRALEMIKNLGLNLGSKVKILSKGNREKVGLILTMSRDASLYLLDEPIAGVDPATRDYILDTIIKNYNENATIIISTHLIADIETILSDVLFIKNGEIVLADTVDNIREREGKSVDDYFREVFKC